ncbi:hypothetical protein TNCV_4337801 [Trichonephila clavipes]|uniref:Uncharacterized protein n=1 Tax=Trichonephila clavipes TaxID=2585209 RepID=A0A8X6VQ71_TRICX|nr:hypothetical protein TNCV_4337801 [Trichonephila clavipes]
MSEMPLDSAVGTSIFLNCRPSFPYPGKTQDMSSKHICTFASRDFSVFNRVLRRRATSLLVRLVEEEERWEVPDNPQNWGGIEPNRTVTCMVIKAEENDRRKSSPLPSMNFVALDLMLISVTVDQVA